jgi:hypothetical protein
MSVYGFYFSNSEENIFVSERVSTVVTVADLSMFFTSTCKNDVTAINECSVSALSNIKTYTAKVSNLNTL